MFLLFPTVVTGCNWYVSDTLIFDVSDRDDDGHTAWQVGGPDCNDANPQVHPAASELCGDSVDNNCDGLTDESGVGNITWYADQDGDGYGTDKPTRQACPDSLRGTGWSIRAGDCNDGDPGVHPGAPEACGDAIDNDCNGEIDELDSNLWMDVDQDGFGDPDTPLPCDQQVLPVGNNLDCDDTRPDVFPDALEICDGVDNDCDSLADELTESATIDGKVNVQSAEEALALADGLVQLCAGTHWVARVQIEPFDDLTVTGVGRDITVLASKHGDIIFDVNRGRLTVEDLTLSGSIGPDISAIRADKSDGITLRRTRVENNGTGINIVGTSDSTLIEDTEIEDNSTGILLSNAGVVSMVGGRLTGNDLGLLYFASDFDGLGVDWGGADPIDIALFNGGSYWYQGVVDVHCDADDGCDP